MLPVVRRVQVVFWPVEISAAFVRPETDTGVWRSVIVPSPSCPASLTPQQDTLPDASRAQECKPPSASWLGLVSVGPATGVVRFVVVPSPISPAKLLPQHQTPPDVR